jgi:hypothetical protein
MADLSDVLTTLYNMAVTAVYPNGTGQPSVAGIPVRISMGWPQPASLDADLLNNIARVSLFPVGGASRNTTRYERQWQTVSTNPATITLTVEGLNVTVGGTVSTPQTCHLIVNKIDYFYAVTADDTLDTIAVALAALIPGASVLENVITLTNAYSIIGRVSTSGTSAMEIARQEQMFQITVWAPANAPGYTGRQALGNAIKVAFDYTYRITLPDQFVGHLYYQRTLENDALQLAQAYRRDLFYCVEYPTTISETTYTIATTDTTIAIVPEITE